MRQFLKYEFKNNWKNFLLSYLLIIVSFIVLSVFILIVKDTKEPTTFMFVLYVNFVVLIFGALIASAILFIINLIKSMYNSIFTDEGYLTLSFPKSVDSLIISKLISNIVWGILYSLAVIIGLCFVYLTLVVAFGQPINEMFSELYKIFTQYNFSFAIVFSSLINGLVESILTFILLFLAFSIINTGIAKKAKVVLGILLYMAFSYGHSMILSIASLFSFGFAVDNTGQLVFDVGCDYSLGELILGGQYYIFDFTQFLINVGLIVGLYFLIRYIIKNKLELE